MTEVLAGTRRDSREQTGHGVSVAEAFRVWLRVAALSFGGPAAQIAVMHRILVEEKKWVSESRFLHALNYCMFLPGPEAQQLATYIGWLMHRTRGGIMAGGLFILPGILALMALSIAFLPSSCALASLAAVASLFSVEPKPNFFANFADRSSAFIRQSSRFPSA